MEVSPFREVPLCRRQTLVQILQGKTDVGGYRARHQMAGVFLVLGERLKKQGPVARACLQLLSYIRNADLRSFGTEADRRFTLEHLSLVCLFLRQRIVYGSVERELMNLKIKF